MQSVYVGTVKITGDMKNSAVHAARAREFDINIYIFSHQFLLRKEMSRKYSKRLE